MYILALMTGLASLVQLDWYIYSGHCQIPQYEQTNVVMYDWENRWMQVLPEFASKENLLRAASRVVTSWAFLCLLSSI